MNSRGHQKPRRVPTVAEGPADRAVVVPVRPVKKVVAPAPGRGVGAPVRTKGDVILAWRSSNKMGQMVKQRQMKSQTVQLSHQEPATPQQARLNGRQVIKRGKIVLSLLAVHF